MIYTSYYGIANKLPANIVRVAISGGLPEGYDGIHYKLLAPKYSNFKDLKDGRQSFAQYADRYRKETLGSLNVNKVAAELINFGKGNDVVLLCFEKNPSECHRSLVSEWLTKGGITSREFQL